MSARELAIAGSACLLLLAAPARAGEKLACVEAYEQGQILRKAHDLKGARAELLACSRDSCPAVLVKDCAPWLAEVERDMPSVVLEVRDAGGATLEAGKVLIDDELVARRLDGTAIELNPGTHRIAVETPGGRPVRELVTVAEGEKEHRVRVTVPLSPTQSEETPAPPPPAASFPVAAIALTGVGAVGVTGFAVFGVFGNNRKADLDAAGCKPRCSASAVSIIKRDYVIADVSLAVGAGSLAVAAYLFIARAVGEPRTKVDVDQVPGAPSSRSRTASELALSRARERELRQLVGQRPARDPEVLRGLPLVPPAALERFGHAPALEVPEVTSAARRLPVERRRRHRRGYRPERAEGVTRGGAGAGCGFTVSSIRCAVSMTCPRASSAARMTTFRSSRMLPGHA